MSNIFKCIHDCSEAIVVSFHLVRMEAAGAEQSDQLLVLHAASDELIHRELPILVDVQLRKDPPGPANVALPAGAGDAFHVVQGPNHVGHLCQSYATVIVLVIHLQCNQKLDPYNQ